MGAVFSKETGLQEAKDSIEGFQYNDKLSSDDNVVNFFKFMVKDEKSYTPESTVKFYKAFALNFHPDKFSGGDEFFKAVVNIMGGDLIGNEENMVNLLRDKKYQKPVLDFFSKIDGAEASVIKIKEALEPKPSILSKALSFLTEGFSKFFKFVASFMPKSAAQKTGAKQEAGANEGDLNIVITKNQPTSSNDIGNNNGNELSKEGSQGPTKGQEKGMGKEEETRPRGP